MKALVQLERITFRAVLVFLRTALFVCSESDTFLMNFNTKYKWFVERKYIVLNFHTFLPGTGTGWTLQKNCGKLFDNHYLASLI